MAFRNTRQVKNKVLDLHLILLHDLYSQSRMHLILWALYTQNPTFKFLLISMIPPKNQILLTNHKMRNTQTIPMRDQNIPTNFNNPMSFTFIFLSIFTKI